MMAAKDRGAMYYLIVLKGVERLYRADFVLTGSRTGLHCDGLAQAQHSRQACRYFMRSGVLFKAFAEIAPSTIAE